MVSMVTLFGLFTKAKQVNCGLAEVPMVCIFSMASLLTEYINQKHERTTWVLLICGRDGRSIVRKIAIQLYLLVERSKKHWLINQALSLSRTFAGLTE